MKKPRSDTDGEGEYEVIVTSDGQSYTHMQNDERTNKQIRLLPPEAKTKT